MESYLRLEDGKIYAFSSLRAANALPTAGVWYRQDLLDEVGAEVPSTLEEVIEVSNKVKEKHPDIVPIAASYLHYLNIIKGTYGYSSNEIMRTASSSIQFFLTIIGMRWRWPENCTKKKLRTRSIL